MTRPPRRPPLVTGTAFRGPPEPKPRPAPTELAPPRPAEKRRPIEDRLPEAWRERRQERRARIAAMSRGKRIRRRVYVTSGWLAGGVVVLLVVAVVGFYYLSDVPSPEDLALPQVATVEYSDGTPMARVGDVNRSIVALDKVPVFVQDAVLAAEDRGFYSEPGVSLRGTLRAAFNDLTGGSTQGGSTITQQYAKNAYLSSSQTLSRKLRELAIAVKLDREYSKQQILEFYLNTVYFGRGAYGIQAAAQTFFGRDVGALTLGQGALLAALLKGPSDFDPANDLEASKDRWKYVLDGMVSTGKLTESQRDSQVFPTALPVRAATRLGDTGPNGLIIRQVYLELAAQGISADEINTQGLQIRTTIDRSAQTEAMTALHTVFDGAAYQKAMQQALIAEDPDSGAVLAYYGGADGVGFDYASQGYRPPGSSFKPYTLAAALTQNVDHQATSPLALNSLVDGSFTKVVDGVTISNDPSDRKVSGPSVTLTQAMTYSLNTTFAQLAYDVDPSAVAETAHAVTGMPTVEADTGVKTLQNPNGTTTFGIGIGDYPVRPIDQATGFATFADGGTLHTPYFVGSVRDAAGDVIYTHAGTATRVLDPQVANDVTLSLEGVAAYSGTPLAGGRPSAAKTGTAGINLTATSTSTANSDAWMVGYTPQISTAVWVGTGQTTPIVDANGQPEYGRDLPARTWKLFMDSYLTGKPVAALPTKQLIVDGINLRPTASPTAPRAPATPLPSFTLQPPITTRPAYTPPPTSPAPAPTSAAPPTPSPPLSPAPPPSTCGLLLC